MATDDSAWDSTELFHVTSDPGQLFTVPNLCLECNNIDAFGKVDQTWTSNAFSVEI